MSNIILYDENNIVLQYLKSVNTPDYSGNVLVNPDISSIENIPIKYWKVYDGQVIEMTEEEKNNVDSLLKSKDIPNKNFLVKEYESRLLLKEIWYEIDNLDGTYSIKAEETEYFYINNKVNYRIITKYSYDGTEINKEKWEYYTNGNYIIEKKRMEE